MARQPSRFSTSRHSTAAPSATSISTSKVPVSLPKRLFFPQLPAGSELPPLLACEDRELNAELYEFLAFALRGFVSPWWYKITRYDKEFLPEIVRIVAISLRELEARLAAADLPTLLFRDIPKLVSQHYADYRNAAAKVGTSYAAGGSATLPQIFHQMQPHMAVHADGRWDETYIRHAIEHVLKSCLPAADWEAGTERTIIREIVAKVMLESALQKLTQPWFIYKTMLDLLGPHETPKPVDTRSLPHPRKRFTFQTFAIFFLSAVQTLSGLCLAAIALSQKAVQTIRAINTSTAQVTDPCRVNLSKLLISMIAEILTMRSRAASSSVLLLVELCTGLQRSFIDRALPHVLYQHIITLSRIRRIIADAKTALFPDGYPSVTPPDPTIEEQLILREQLETQLMEMLSPFTAWLLGPDVESRRKTISNAIEPLSHAECNIHLLVLLFDAILLTLFPEMGIEGSSEYIMENRTETPDI